MGYRGASCDQAGTVNFYCTYMMAPARIIDYIVEHELCHFITGITLMLSEMKLTRLCWTDGRGRLVDAEWGWFRSLDPLVTSNTEFF